MKSRLILVRHGETNKNINEELYKFHDPESLNKTGVAQMEKTARELQKYNLSRLFSSRELRAIKSGEIISKVCRIKLNLIDGLEERNWGDYSGRQWVEVKNILDEMSTEERYNYIPTNGESWKDFETRLINATQKILTKHKNETIVVVTHAGAIRALMPVLLNIPKEESFKYEPDNGSISIFDYADGKFEKSSD